MAEIYPNLVVRGKDNQVETVQYYKLDAMLLNEVQKLAKVHAEDSDQIARLEAQVAELRQQDKMQQGELAQLRAQIQGIQAALAGSNSVPRNNEASMRNRNRVTNDLSSNFTHSFFGSPSDKR